jgi:glycosyltransferase involved in cell wall biosynthesis
MLSRVLPLHGPGGMAAAAWDLATALGASGADVEVLTTAGGEVAEPPPGVRVRALAAAPSARYSPQWWRGSRHALRDRPVDVVLGVSAAANALLGPSHRERGPVFVYQAHGTSLGEVASKLRAKRARALAGVPRQLCWTVRDRAYRRYDALAAVGAAVQTALESWPTSLLVGRTPVRLLPNGVDPGAFAFRPTARTALRSRLGIADGTPLLLFAGRLQADKGLATALDVCRGLRGGPRGVRLVVLGQGPDAGRLHRGVAADGLGQVITHVPAVRREEVADWLAAADALLLPTRRAEGLPLITLEALASGLPVITTPAGAADADLPCLRLAPDDVAGMVAAIRRLSSGAPRRSRLPPRFTLQASAERYLALFEELLAARGRMAA